MLLTMTSSDVVLATLRERKKGPKDKYAFPQTEAQEVGWDTERLVREEWFGLGSGDGR